MAIPKQTLVKGVTAPDIAETQAIAEEGFIYGLPIVMNYAVMHELRPVEKTKNSKEFKAPFNRDQERSGSPAACSRQQQVAARRRRESCLHLRGHGRHHPQQ